MTDDVRVTVYPADRYGCGYHRLIWASEYLQQQGHRVTIVTQSERHVEMTINDRTDEVVDVNCPETDVMVFQRVTHRYLVQAIDVIRSRGIAVVVDVDDDLSAIHPDNPAFQLLHPNRASKYRVGKPTKHSWNNLAEACKRATLVTATTPALAQRYGARGNAVVLPNYLADHYYDDAATGHVDSDLLGWPASLHSHPNDPAALGNAVARLVDRGARFHCVSVGEGVADAFGIRDAERVTQESTPTDLLDWPRAIARLGVGIAPLADTRFNAAKSWLKPLELAAVGVPWVGSPRAEYRRLHELGCGLVVDRPKDWFRVLNGLLTNERRRTELSDAGRSVAAQLRLRDHAWKWLEAWSDAVARERAGRRAPAVS